MKSETFVERGGAAEELLNSYDPAKSDAGDIKRIANLLLPRLQARCEQLRKTDGRPQAIYLSELQLAGAIIGDRHLPDETSQALARFLEPVWGQFIPRRPIRFVLHGDINSLTAGTAIHHVLSVTGIDGRPVRKELLETVLFVDEPSGLSWGAQENIRLAYDPKDVLNVELRTTWYRIPLEPIGNLPTRTSSQAELAKMKERLAQPETRKLCTFTRQANLSSDKEWKAFFDSRN